MSCIARLVLARMFSGCIVTILLVGATTPAWAGPKVYWTERFEKKIGRANLDGTNMETILTAADGISEPRGIAVDDLRGLIYWADGGGQIKRARLDGSNVETVRSSGLSSNWGLDVDVKWGMIYFSDSSYSADRIGHFDSNGENFEILWTGQRNPVGIDLDVVGGMAYWVYGDGVRRAPLDRSGPIQDLVGGQNWPMDVVVDRAAGKFYFTDFMEDTVKSADLSGANLRTLFHRDDSDPFGIDLYDGYIYFTDGLRGTLERMRTDGTNLETLATGLKDPIGMAILVPEPSSLVLLTIGVVVSSVCARRWRRR